MCQYKDQKLHKYKCLTTNTYKVLKESICIIMFPFTSWSQRLCACLQLSKQFTMVATISIQPLIPYPNNRCFKCIMSFWFQQLVICKPIDHQSAQTIQTKKYLTSFVDYNKLFLYNH